MDEGKFDFHQATEEEENLDYNKLKPCPKCKKPIACDATMCYFCGSSLEVLSKPLWIVWVAVIIVIIFAISIIL
jgi:hypothetical protein|tara:strand:+ start:42 stop:263 length:222 start_codon:yes stop_codon:yes gene_type:complete